ncbi:hypothetical protein [Pseudoramibacter sp.]|jgi:ribosomal protein S27E|uniref:hypothetical protein n=1 Tax=Pseudoramibacter sp. TaxID=2034862 RepID=UPI0025F682DF|nr:hypothetical protein [Pseudoramibacter sp.]MCH4072900.1 zinc ribbon domain-containing protein [Pseudoramibacter sp.]MCH4106671.1 zinc ribbon domain-containing protein [Pseudoramibacter sp.]
MADNNKDIKFQNLVDRIDELEQRVDTLERDIETMSRAESDDDYYEVTCQNCDHTFIAGFQDFASDQVICPECGEKFHLDKATLNKLQDHDGHNH